MFLGRAGLMAYYAKKKMMERRNQPRHQYLLDHLNKFQQGLARKKQRNRGIMFYRSIPKGAWFLGWLFIVLASWLLYVIHSGMLEMGAIDDELNDEGLTKEQLHKMAYEKGLPHVDVTPDEPITYWWRYLVILLMWIMGLIFLMSVDYSTVEIHREHKIMILGQTNPWLCCRRKTQVRDLELLTDVVLVKRGHDANQQNTIYYAIEFRYGELSEKRMAARREEIMEFSDMREAKKKYVEVMTFIDRSYDIANVQVHDESTSNKKKKTAPKKHNYSPNYNQNESATLLRHR